MAIQELVKKWNKLKASHDNYKRIDDRLVENGFVKKLSYYDSKNGTASNIDDGGEWEKDGVKIVTHYCISFSSFTPRSLEIKIVVMCVNTTTR